MKKRVIIIEDDIVWQENLEKVFEEEGHEVIGVFCNQQGVLQMVKQQSPDLLIIDIELSGSKQAGIELANSLKEFNIVFVYLTALDEVDDTTHIEAYKNKNAKPFKYISKLDYLLDPNRTVRFLIRELEAKKPTFTTTGGHIIYCSNILWVTGEHKLWEIYCKGNKSYRYNGQLIDFIDENNHQIFLRKADRNKVINIAEVRAWSKIDHRRYAFYFNVDKSLPKHGIVASGRKSIPLLKEIKALRS